MPDLGKMFGFKNVLKISEMESFDCGLLLYLHFILHSHLFLKHYMYGQIIFIMNFVFR